MSIHSKELEVLIETIAQKLVSEEIIPKEILQRKVGHLIAQEAVRLIIDEGDVLFGVTIRSFSKNHEVSDFIKHTIKRSPIIHWIVNEIPSYVTENNLKEFYKKTLKLLVADLLSYNLHLIILPVHVRNINNDEDTTIISVD